MTRSRKACGRPLRIQKGASIGPSPICIPTEHNPRTPRADILIGQGSPFDEDFRTALQLINPDPVAISLQEGTTKASIPESGTSIVPPSQFLRRIVITSLSQLRHSIASMPTFDQTRFRTT